MKIINCGCSWAYGSINHTAKNIFTKIDEYGFYLAKKLNADYLSLAKPGASNYCIAKQVEYALQNLNPDFILFNATTSRRMDFLEDGKSLGHTPTLVDFDYQHVSHKNEVTGNFSGPLISQPYHSLQIVGEKSNNSSFTEVAKFMTMYGDFHLRNDIDRFIVKGVIAELERHNVPFYCIDFDNIITEHDESNILHLSHAQLRETFPVLNDPYHFSAEGHSHISELLYKLYTENK